MERLWEDNFQRDVARESQDDLCSVSETGKNSASRRGGIGTVFYSLLSKPRFWPGVRNRFLLAAGLLSLITASPAYAIGPFEDVARLSTFLRSPQRGTISSSITRANAQGEASSFFWLAGQVPVRSNFFLQVDVPYISVARGEDIEDGFGDINVLARVRAWEGNRKRLFLMGTFRLGSGSASLFPYSTASSDVEIGLAFVDSVGTVSGMGGLEPLRSISYWMNLSASYIVRLNDRLDEAELHGDHLDFGGGVIYPLTHRIEIEAGGMGLFFKSGAVREIYYGQVVGRFSPSIDLFLTIQAERGKWQDRAIDGSVSIGMLVSL